MAPIPLRGAFAFLLCALLAAPSHTQEIGRTGEAGKTNTGSGQAGSIGAAGPGSIVAPVPTLGLGLTPSLGQSGAPAPLAAPAPANIQAAPTALELNPPAGFYGHDPSKPVHFPLPDGSPNPLDAEPAIKKTAAKKPSGPPAPPSITAPIHGSASKGEGGLKNTPAALVPAGLKGDAQLKALYDGGAIRDHDDDPVGKARTGVYEAVSTPDHASGLAPAAKGLAKTPGTPAPPAPSGVFAKGWFKGAVTGAVNALSNAFAKSEAPTLKVTAPAASQETVASAQSVAGASAARGERILVRAARSRSFDAAGYRVLFTRPKSQGLSVTPSADESVSVRLERRGDAAQIAGLRERFAVFNGLIESNFAALELIAQNSSKMTVKTARAVQDHVAAMSVAYSQLAEGNEAREADALGVTLELARIKGRLELAMKGLADSDLIPPAAVALIMPIDKPSLHKYLNHLHQEALETVGKANASTPANLTVRLGEGDEEKAVSLVDLSENPLVKDKRVVSPGFKALLAAMTRSKDTPGGSLIMQDHQFWGHFQLGAHSAEIYASFLQPDEGGMIRVRYQEWGTGYDNQTRLYYVGRLLHKAGFHVEQKNGFLTAVVDKDHAAQTVDEMTDTFALVVQALHATVGVDFALPLLVKGAKTSEEVGARIDEWVDIVLGEGTLPFFVHDDHDAMVEGWKKYNGESQYRSMLRKALNDNLVRLGLPAIPAGERVGQRTIDRFVNDPIEAAIARGQLALTAGSDLVRVPDYDPLASLASSLAGPTLAGAKMAEVLSSLDPALFKYETIGMLGGLTVERAQRRMDPKGWITVYALRDPKGGQIGLARAEISSLAPGESPHAVTPVVLFSVLRAQGYAIAEFKPSEAPAGFDHFQRLLHETRPIRAGVGRVFQGLAASPGHGRTVLARITYDKAVAAKGGYIFVAPYTTPDDLDAIKGSKAVITTSGGLLSHAAITTREMGIPAAILPRVDWKDGVAALNVFGLGRERKAGAITVRDAKSERPVTLAEGDLVRLDPATGAVETFPTGVGAPLLDAAAGLERFDESGDQPTLVRGLTNRIASQSLSYEQKAILVREMLAGAFARQFTDPRASGLPGRLFAAMPGPDDVLGMWARRSVDALMAVELEDAAASLRAKRELIDEALSTESLERLVREADARVRGLLALSSDLKRPKAELAAVEIAHSSMREEARARHGKLLAEEMSELQRHARLFPAATVEALPRIKAAIAKARRRNLNADMIRTWEAQAARLESGRRESMERAAPAVLPLSSILDVDVPWVGGKAAKLGEIAAVVRAAGGEVPPGLALTVHAYRRFLTESGIADKLEALGKNPSLTVEQRSERARRLILDAKLSAKSGVGREILAGLAAQGLDKGSLAVRSSAVDEDGAEAAFAGAGDTHLYVNPDELLEHVKDVWASLWNPRALLYRETRGLSTLNLAQAVVVQKMVDSEVSGVAFTQDPVSGSSGRVIVNGAFGLGEGIVSGRVAPDQYVLSKTNGREMLPAMIADKKVAFVRGKDGRGTIEHKMPAEWRRRRSMSPAKLKLLSDVSVALERHFGYALDIEFGFVDDKLYILQSRAVTSNAVEKPVPVPAVPEGSQMKPAAAPQAKRITFVCTGNTCRSPMAAHLAREKLERRGRGDIEVFSRGLSVSTEGEDMNPKAKDALTALGSAPGSHTAKTLSADDAAKSTVILTMTEAQAEAARSRFPEAAKKIFSLAAYAKKGGDVNDPYGGDADAYRAAATEIGDALDAFIDKVPAGKTAVAR